MKLISLNIEDNKHLTRVLPFVQNESPDVLCLQEVFEVNLEQFKNLGYTCVFFPDTQKPLDGVFSNNGEAICTRGEIQNHQVYYYRNNDAPLQRFNQAEKLKSVHSMKNGILCADILLNGDTYRIATTHFTWGPDGTTASAEQIADMGVLLSLSQRMSPHVLCGDFNIARNSNPLYTELLAHYTDAVPLSYTSSLDANLHRLGSVPEKRYLFDSYMVDYVFTQPSYMAHDVRLEFGVSDHAAIVATITKG
jgi:endonuclease/exonuclease/phosphatase family metal-dependent hydrolase